MGSAGFILANFVDGASVWMIQGSSRLGFALEPAEGLRIIGYVVAQELEGYNAPKICILSFVNDAHATASEFFDDAKVRDGAAGQRLRIRHVVDILGCSPEPSQRRE